MIICLKAYEKFANYFNGLIHVISGHFGFLKHLQFIFDMAEKGTK